MTLKMIVLDHIMHIIEHSFSQFTLFLLINFGDKFHHSKFHDYVYSPDDTGLDPSGNNVTYDSA